MCHFQLVSARRRPHPAVGLPWRPQRLPILVNSRPARGRGFESRLRPVEVHRERGKRHPVLQVGQSLGDVLDLSPGSSGSSTAEGLVTRQASHDKY